MGGRPARRLLRPPAVGRDARFGAVQLPPRQAPRPVRPPDRRRLRVPTGRQGGRPGGARGDVQPGPELAPFPVKGSCVACDGGLGATYTDERLKVRCAECERVHANFAFPPGGLEDRTREEVLAAFNQRARHLAYLTADGVCPDCNGRIQTAIEPADEDIADLDLVVRHECQRCGNPTVSSVGLALLDDAEIVSFYRDHGIDLNTVRFWTLEWCVSDHYTEVLSRDPWRLRVTIPLGDEELRVTVDDALAVQHTERRARSGDPVGGTAGADDGSTDGSASTQDA